MPPNSTPATSISNASLVETMPTYYFDVFDGNGLTRDETGMEFASMDEAIAEARRALGGMVKDALSDGGADEIEIRIRDGDEGPVHLHVTMTAVKPDAQA